MAMLRYRCGTLPNAINRRLSIKLEQQRVTGSRTVSKHPWPPRSPPPRPGPPTRTPVRDAGRSIFFSRISAFGLDAVPATSFSVSKVFVGSIGPPPSGPRRPPRPCDTLGPLAIRDTPKFFSGGSAFGLAALPSPYYHPQWCKPMAGPPRANTPLQFFRQKSFKMTK